MIVGVTFNDSPSMHDIMTAANDNIMTVVRVHIDGNSIIPTNEQMLQILDLHLLAEEYMGYLSIYYDSGHNIEQFQRFALERIRAIYDIT